MSPSFGSILMMSAPLSASRHPPKRPAATLTEFGDEGILERGSRQAKTRCS